VLFNDTTRGQAGSFEGNTFRRNTLVTSDGPAFMFRQARLADKTTIQGNTLFRTGEGGPDKAMVVGEKSVKFSEFEHFSSGYGENTYADPKFASCRHEDHKTPETFNFRRYK
jgi:hypothetical protein